jgi:hypothetical protein
MGNKIRRHNSTSHSQTSARDIQDLQEDNLHIAIVTHEAWQKYAEERNNYANDYSHFFTTKKSILILGHFQPMQMRYPYILQFVLMSEVKKSKL